jgi:cytoskeletal protein RodZ
VLLLNNCEDLREISDFEQLGKALKCYRERANITLEQIQKATKIRIKYLSGIEEGKFSDIPGGDVYVKGFLKNYCKAVGIESREVLSSYKKIKGENVNVAETLNKKNEENKTGLSLKRINFEHFMKKKYITVVVLLLIIVFALFRLNKGSNSPKVNNSVKRPPTISEDNNQRFVDGEENNEQNPKDDLPVEHEKQPAVNLIEDSQSATVYEVLGTHINVELKIIDDRCWVSVKRDDIADYEGILNQGDSKTLKADEILNIRIGNPQVVTIVANDEDLGIPGGKARNIIFKRKI